MNYHELKKRIARFFHGPARRKPSQAERAGLVLGEEGNEVQRESRGAFQGKIKFRGQGNIVRFLAESHFTGDIKVHGDNHLFEFGAHSKIRGRIFATEAGRKVIERSSL